VEDVFTELALSTLLQLAQAHTSTSQHGDQSGASDYKRGETSKSKLI
jgi:hypothetical protein